MLLQNNSKLTVTVKCYGGGEKGDMACAGVAAEKAYAGCGNSP